LVATITNDVTIDDVFIGQVKVTQNQRRRNGRQITDAKWLIGIESIDADICKNVCDADPDCTDPATMLNWHIHEKAIPEGGGCGASDTGGHWDPTFGCGGASQYQGDGDWCDLLATNTGGMDSLPSVIMPERVNPQTCDPLGDITKCEMGDLSGKMGQVMIAEGSTQRFNDMYISNLDNIKDLSIIFHCGAPRVACGNFVVVGKN
jgi:hypothetical protein